jgi:hypothetical protein
MPCSQWSRWDEKELVQWERSCHHARLIFVVFLLKTLDRFFDLLTCLQLTISRC